MVNQEIVIYLNPKSDYHEESDRDEFEEYPSQQLLFNYNVSVEQKNPKQKQVKEKSTHSGTSTTSKQGKEKSPPIHAHEEPSPHPEETSHITEKKSACNKQTCTELQKVDSHRHEVKESENKKRKRIKLFQRHSKAKEDGELETGSKCRVCRKKKSAKNPSKRSTHKGEHKHLKFGKSSSRSQCIECKRTLKKKEKKVKKKKKPAKLSSFFRRIMTGWHKKRACDSNLCLQDAAKNEKGESKTHNSMKSSDSSVEEMREHKRRGAKHDEGEGRDKHGKIKHPLKIGHHESSGDDEKIIIGSPGRFHRQKRFKAKNVACQCKDMTEQSTESEKSGKGKPKI